MKKRVLTLLIIIFLGATFFFIWFKEAIRPPSPSSKETKIFVIRQGQDIREIARNLKKEGLIRDQLAFFILIKRLGIERNIQAGDFRLSAGWDAETVAKTLTHGTLDIWITIIEGWRVEEIALKLAQELALPEREFLKYAQEGFMFPDTYLLAKDASASTLVKILRENFDRRVDEEIRKKAKEKGLSLNQLITIASIVEREARLEEDRPIVAGILLKRLNNGWPLQADATVQYALGYDPGQKTWWKKQLTSQDLSIDSLYNTYKHSGLPPAPICNPGLAAIRAVIESTETDYWYYLSDKEGRTHYAKTIEEHEENITKYLR